MYSIDRVSRLASRAVASSSTNDERGRFPINRQSHSSDPRHRTTRACVCAFSTRVGQADHRSRLITEPPPLSLSPKYLSRRQKAVPFKHTPGRTDRSTRSIDSIEPTETRSRPDRPVIDPSSTRSIDPIDPIDPIDVVGTRARVGGVMTTTSTTTSTTTRSWEELRKEARRAESRVERELGELGRRGTRGGMTTRDEDARRSARMNECE